VAIVEDGAKLLAAARSLRPDVIIADISMPVLDGLEALRRLKSEQIGSRVILLTMHAEKALAAEALRAGAAGYLLKQSAAEELVTAIREVLNGRVYVSPMIARQAIHALSAPRRSPAGREGDPLTQRQRQVLKLVAQGMTMKEVADALTLSRRTVESHKYEMMEVLGVHSTAELVHYAIRKGVVSLESAEDGAGAP